MTSPAELPDLLRRLEDHWIHLDVPLARRAAPGLSDQEIDDLLAPTGFELPEEMRIWWRWHNGMTEPDVRDLDATVSASGWRLQTLQHSIREYQMLIDVVGPDGITFRWEWFPFSPRADAEQLMCDTSRTDGRTAPVIAWDNCVAVEEQLVIAPSLTDLVRMWVERLDAGIVTQRLTTPENGFGIRWRATSSRNSGSARCGARRHRQRVGRWPRGPTGGL